MPRKVSITKSHIRIFVTAALLSVSAACTHVRLKKDSDAVHALEQICSFGQDSKRVEGGVWIKATSPDAKGQFPAEVEAIAPDSVMMEVTNLIGETQASIKVQGATYRIAMPGRKLKVEEGTGAWGGIPLEWAAALFLGRFPCPAELDDSRLSVQSGPDDMIVVKRVSDDGASSEEYLYKVTGWAGMAWPESLQWSRTGSSASSVTFRFEKPDAETGAPLQWEARSDRGEVKVRWRSRKVEEPSEKRG